MQHFVTVWFQWVHDWGYLGVILLMAMESSIFPVPSEIVIPPAAYLAAQGHMNIWGVIAAGTFGSWLGSAITYWISLWVGRVFIVKYGRYFFISEQKLIRAEHMIHRYETGGILFARLLPVIRHLISIPAGIVRMPFKTFSLMTVIGSAIWCSVLALLTRQMFNNYPNTDMPATPADWLELMKPKSLWIACFVILMATLYFVGAWLTAPKDSEEPAPEKP